MDVLISFCSKYEQLNQEDNINIDDWRSLSGFKQLLFIKKKLEEEKCQILVNSTDDLFLCINKIFNFLGIPLKPEYLQQKECSTEGEIADKSKQWKENKRDSLFYYWHKEALMSDDLHKNRSRFLDEIRSVKHRAMIEQLARELMPLYGEIFS